MKTPEEQEKQKVWTKFVEINKGLIGKNKHIQYYDMQIKLPK